MPSFKNDRMAEDIHRELTDIFRMVKDPRVSSMLTIVRVELAGDGSHCKAEVISARKKHYDIENGYHYLEPWVKLVDNAASGEILSDGDISQHSAYLPFLQLPEQQVTGIAYCVDLLAEVKSPASELSENSGYLWYVQTYLGYLVGSCEDLYRLVIAE